MKTAAIMFSLAFLTIVVSGKPNQTRNIDKQKSQQKPPATVTLINNESPETHPEKTNNNPPKWYAAIKRPEWWLVFVGFATLGFVGWQAYETRRAVEVAQDNVKVFISKERARLRIDLKSLNLVVEEGGYYTVDFTISIHGTTAAYIGQTRCVAYKTPQEYINEPELGQAIMFPIHSLPNVVRPDSPPIESWALLDSAGSYKESILSEIKQGRLFVGIRGFIKYKDAFDNDRETRFRYVWKFDKGFGMIYEHGNWEKCGAPEENYES